MQRVTAFTLATSKGLLRRLVTGCGVCEPVIPQSGKNVEISTFTALWDTGAMTSTISNKVIQTLRLSPFDQAKVYHANGDSIVGKYKVSLFLPNNVYFPMLTVLSGNLHGCDVLIGMDIISQGDFVITNRDGKTVFSFQVPSTHYYDFVKQSKTR